MLADDKGARFGLATAAATAVILFTSLTYKFVLDLKGRAPKKNRNQLDLAAWKKSGLEQNSYRAVWADLIPFLQKNELVLWEYDGEKQRPPNSDFPIKDNYIYLEDTDPSRLALLATYLPPDGLSHAARSTNDLPRDFALRIITAGGQGQVHRKILRDLCVRPEILFSVNHILPMVKEIVFEDITIGVFPRMLHKMLDAVVQSRRSGDKTSFEDILYIILQALEGINHIHSKRIAHCDMFLNNLMIEWIPQSLVKHSTTSRPRVYLVNFDNAVQFPEESHLSDHLVHDRPLPAVVTDYYRVDAPELGQEGPYCPFRLDMWQFGYFFHQHYMTKIPEIDELWTDLVSPKPEDRPTALEAMSRLSEFVASTTRGSLQIGFT